VYEVCGNVKRVSQGKLWIISAEISDNELVSEIIGIVV
jgi:hypothetical protein